MLCLRPLEVTSRCPEERAGPVSKVLLCRFAGWFTMRPHELELQLGGELGGQFRVHVRGEVAQGVAQGQALPVGVQQQVARLDVPMDDPHRVHRLQGRGQPERLTVSNPWLADVELARHEVVRYRARDGLELEGVLVYPLNYLPGRRYPLIFVWGLFWKLYRRGVFR